MAISITNLLGFAFFPPAFAAATDPITIGIQDRPIETAHYWQDGSRMSAASIQKNSRLFADDAASSLILPASASIATFAGNGVAVERTPNGYTVKFPMPTRAWWDTFLPDAERKMIVLKGESLADLYRNVVSLRSSYSHTLAIRHTPLPYVYHAIVAAIERLDPEFFTNESPTHLESGVQIPKMPIAAAAARLAAKYTDEELIAAAGYHIRKHPERNIRDINEWRKLSLDERSFSGPVLSFTIYGISPEEKEQILSFLEIPPEVPVLPSGKTAKDIWAEAIGINPREDRIDIQESGESLIERSQQTLGLALCINASSRALRFLARSLRLDDIRCETFKKPFYFAPDIWFLGEIGDMEIAQAIFEGLAMRQHLRRPEDDFERTIALLKIFGRKRFKNEFFVRQIVSFLETMLKDMIVEGVSIPFLGVRGWSVSSNIPGGYAAEPKHFGLFKIALEWFRAYLKGLEIKAIEGKAL